ncbi:MAG: hypothetical protein PHN92_02515 [Geobacter sp.]|nr:hypothetical protein [Geobacter sp.]
MSSLKLLLYGLASEQSALLVIFGAQPVWQRLLLFFCSHLLASVLFSLLLTATFPKRFIAARRGLLGLFFCFNFFVPVLGAVGTLLVLLYFRKYLDSEERIEFSNVTLPPFLAESSEMASGMGEGGAWSRLRSVGLPRAQRLKALLAVGSGGGNNTSRFLQLATADNDDEIRLLAFNLCERQEQKIQQSISTALEELKLADTTASQVSLCRNLAFSYWEMVYSTMAQDELRDFFVEQATRYANQAHQLGDKDPILATLMVRIYLQKHQYQQAEEAVHEALALGADLAKVVPYQAELAFYKRDFSAIRALLGSDATVRFRPYIGPVAQFWGGR